MKSIHPLAELLPDMPPEEYAELCEDIRRHGLQEPIWTLNGKVLDGRHRERACAETRTKPTYRAFTGKSPASFVLGANIHRRHLDSGQRAVIALEFLPELEREAAKRKGGDRKSPASKGRTRATTAHAPKATAEAAAKTGASPRSVQAAKRVAKHAPEMLPEVKAGKTSLRSAERKAAAKQAEPALSAAEQDMRFRRTSTIRQVRKAYLAVTELGPCFDEVVDALVHDKDDQHATRLVECERLLARIREAIKPQPLRRVQ